jgi:hypothetical protein
VNLIVENISCHEPAMYMYCILANIDEEGYIANINSCEPVYHRSIANKVAKNRSWFTESGT